TTPQFIGPGTYLEGRLAHGEAGRNILDNACLKYDMAYSHKNNSGSNARGHTQADRRLVERALSGMLFGLWVVMRTAYAGEERLLRATRKKFRLNEARECLESQDAHTMDKMVRHHFSCLSYWVFSTYELWKADLIDPRVWTDFRKAYEGG
ncbi:hypothetical protein TSAR_014312, partial [Trichomalopsis sarcophagae]